MGETSKVVGHLESSWGHRPCPMCGNHTWNVADKMFQLMEFTEGGLKIGGPVLPVIPVVCTKCGNTVLVNALVAGVVEPSQDEGR